MGLAIVLTYIVLNLLSVGDMLPAVPAFVCALFRSRVL